jgi:hypothetical protein
MRIVLVATPTPDVPAFEGVARHDDDDDKDEDDNDDDDEEELDTFAGEEAASIEDLEEDRGFCSTPEPTTTRSAARRSRNGPGCGNRREETE